MNKKVIFLLFAGVLMGAIDIAIIGPALPAIHAAFSISDRDLPWLFNIYVLFNLVSTPIMGKLSDIYGRRLIYILDLSLFALGSLVVIASNSFTMLLVGRAIQGFGAGGIFPVAAAVIGDVIPKEKQGSALGWIGAVFGLAFIVGPAIGGLLLLLGWHWIFVINLPAAALLILFSYRILPHTHRKESLRFDYAGMFLLVALLASFAYGINRIDTGNFMASISNPGVYGFLLFTLVAVFVFYRIEKKSADPAINLSLLSSRQLLFTYFIAFGAGIGELSSVYIPSLAIDAFQVSKSTASFMLMPLVGMLFISAPVAGRLIDRTGAKPVIMMGIAGMLAGLLVFALLAMTKFNFYLAQVCLGFGLAFLLGAPLRYIMNHETTEGTRAAGQSLLTVFTSTGQLMSAALIGALIASFGGGITGYKNGFLALSVMSIVLLVISFGLKNTSSK